MAAQQLDPLQTALDMTVATWPDVRAKNVFGHRGYVRGGKMFGFLADTGVAVKAVNEELAEELYATEGVGVFTYNGMEMRAWPVLPLRSDTDLDAALTALQRAYDAV